MRRRFNGCLSRRRNKLEVGRCGRCGQCRRQARGGQIELGLREVKDRYRQNEIFHSDERSRV